MSTTIPHYIQAKRGDNESVCRIDLGRQVQQYIELKPIGDGITTRLEMADKLYDGHDVSLIIKEIFGKKTLDTADVRVGGIAYRQEFWGKTTSMGNSLVTLHLEAEGAALRVEFETEKRMSLWDRPSREDLEGRQIITITAKDDVITRMIEHPEFAYVCDSLRAAPAAKYKPRTHEFKVDLGRPVFQPTDGDKIGDSAARGDVALLMGKIFGREIFYSVKMSVERARRIQKLVLETPKAYMGVEIKKPDTSRVKVSTRLSDWNVIREMDFSVGDRKISACFESGFKVGEPNPLPADDAAGRQVITIKGPKDLVDRVSGFEGINALCDELRGRDITGVKRKLEALINAPIPTPKTPRGNGPSFPRHSGMHEGAPEGQPSFTRDGISVPARFRDERQGGFHDDEHDRFSRDRTEVLLLSREGPGSMRRYSERRDDNNRPFGAPRYQDQFMKPPRHMRSESEKPKAPPPRNVVEGVALLKMRARPGNGRRIR